MVRAFYSRLLARPGLVIILALLTAVPMTYWSVLLFGDLRADVKELLPENARAVEVLRVLEKRFGGFSQLSMIVESPDRAANRKFSDDLVERLSKSDMVRSIRNKLGAEREFFESKRFLYVDVEDLETILERLENAANDARARANPLLVDLENKGPVELDLSDIEKKYASKFSLATRFPEGYFESEDGREIAIILRKHGLAFGVGANRQLTSLVHQTIAELDPHKYHPEMKVSLGGDVQNLIEEQTSLVEDLVTATVVVTVLLGLMIVVYYRRIRALYLIFIPVLIGCAWTFGVSHFVIGYLNASSAFLGPIVPGNGMNFSLILLARYLEERRRGKTIDAATQDAVEYTVKATSLVAIAASIAYGSLMATDFLGFKHFGIIGGIGMLLCWLATFLVMPPLILWVERRFPQEMNKEMKLLRPGTLSSVPARLVSAAPAAIAWTGIIAAAAGIYLSAIYLRDPFEKDFNKLRSTAALTGGAAITAAKVDKIFGMYQEPQVIIAEHEEEVVEIVAALEKAIAEGGEKSALADVTALVTLVPKRQEEKLEVLKKIRGVLTDDLLSNLEPEQRKLAETHRPPEDLKPFGVKDLPESVRADFRELDGREGRVVLALPNMKLNLYHADEIRRVADALRGIKLKDGTVVDSSGNFVIYSDMIDAIKTDGPKATAYSLAGVIILCVIAYRRVRRAATVVGALIIGVAWLGGLMFLGDIKINFLNFIALPITFGIGADYAVNIYTRYLLERKNLPPAEAAFETISSTGGAVVLCSLSTIIGYASLVVARNGALISFGKIAILGEFACLGAAIIVLPAILMAWRDREASKSVAEDK